jgi:hypothetical protein
MADYTHLGTSQATVDTRDGNHFEIFKVVHVSGSGTNIPVPDGCVSAACLFDDQVTGIVPIQEKTTAAGVAVRNLTSGANGAGQTWATNDGLKQITIHAGVVSGTYIIVARYVGSAAGSGGGDSTDL